MKAELLNYLLANNSADISVLFQISVNLGDYTTKHRFAVDNAILTTDALGPWLPWPIETQEFIQRMSDDKQPTEITIYDPEDAEAPGQFKRLLQYEKILNRAQFDLWLIVKDVSTHYSKTFTRSATNEISIQSGHNLGVYDKLGISGVKYTVLSVSGDTIGLDANPPASGTAYLPFYKDETTWIKKVSGKLRKATFMDGYTVLTIGQESDLLSGKVPRAGYGYQCPYLPGDKNCLGFGIDTVVTTTKVYDIISVSGKDVVVQSQTTDLDVPPLGHTKSDYWTLGSFVVLTGSLAGYVRSIRSCVYNSNTPNPHRFSIVVDTALPTLSGGSLGTVRLHFNCNRTYADCVGRFCNGKQYGGMESLVRAVGGLNVPRDFTK